MCYSLEENLMNLCFCHHLMVSWSMSSREEICEGFTMILAHFNEYSLLRLSVRRIGHDARVRAFCKEILRNS